ncbi:MAG: ribosome small subunit-dependent GTPase A [Burkholderiales bacterium]|nr:ribosome small subunit-dependent GTPase A [Burkholderiales bacterium]
MLFQNLDIERLRAIGCTPAIVQQCTALLSDLWDARRADLALMRVTEVQREGLRLHDGQAEHPARQLPALRDELAAQADALAVGDWVLVALDDTAQWWVLHRIPPLNQLARRLHDGRDKVTRTVIVSNVDTALLVMGLDHDFNLRRLERYSALVRMAGVGALVVLTKADLCADAQARLREVQAVLPTLPVVALDALQGDVDAALKPWLQPGQTLVLLGSSGTGKSTLTNALLGRAHQLTGANRDGDSRGRHTTTARSLHVTPHGACVIDTPGLRTLRLDGDEAQLATVFDDVARLALQCRFRDCQHRAEPGCAVRDGVGDERLRNYQKLLREARRDTITALERKVEVARWKTRGRAARVRLNAKRGDG